MPANITNRSNDDVALLLIRDYSDKYDAKIDGQINDKMSAFLRFSQRKDIQYYQPDLTGPSGGDGNGYIHAIDQKAAVGYTWIVTPLRSSKLRFGWTHVLAGKDPPYIGGPSLAVALRLSGPADHARISPAVSTPRPSADSHAHGPPDQQSAVPESDLLWIRSLISRRSHGPHSIKTGYEFTGRSAPKFST